MNLTRVALMTQTVVSVGLILFSSGIVLGAAIALILAMVVEVFALRLIREASASVPVLIDQRSELHWAEMCAALISNKNVQTADVKSPL
jgi:hypothetical protein